MDEKQKPATKNTTKAVVDRVTGLDISYQNLKVLGSSILLLNSIKELILNNNELTVIPKDIYKLNNLEKLNLSYNKIKAIPPDLGKAVSLKELLLNDNLISSVPMELGTLFNIEILNLNNNPLIVPFNTLNKDRLLIHFCRENNTAYKPPMDRAWIDCLHKSETKRNNLKNYSIFTVGTYNILCNFYSFKCTYAPSWVINPELRRENILQNIISYNVDILGVQELEVDSYERFYREHLSLKSNYDSVYFARKGTSVLSDSRSVDGCAIFWKKDKFKLIEKRLVDYTDILLKDKRFSHSQEILNRNCKRDNIGVIVVLENSDKFPIIVVNTHLYWHPDYSDVKFIQTLLLIEEIEFYKLKYRSSPVLLIGDFNSLKNSSVYNLIINSKIEKDNLGMVNLVYPNHKEIIKTQFFDSYKNQDLTFTNFTPTFKETIDYIFYTNQLQLAAVLSPIEEEYTESCVGLPNVHFPSDHLFIGAKFMFKKEDLKIDK